MPDSGSPVERQLSPAERDAYAALLYAPAHNAQNAQIASLLRTLAIQDAEIERLRVVADAAERCLHPRSMRDGRWVEAVDALRAALDHYYGSPKRAAPTGEQSDD